MKIQDSALVSAVRLSHRYISGRFLPDKAIDLVDEACAMLRTEIDSMPAELDELTRRVMRLEIEEAALAKERTWPVRSGCPSCVKELADLRSEADAMRAQWEAERQALHKVQELRQEIEQVRRRGRGGRAGLRPQRGGRAPACHVARARAPTRRPKRPCWGGSTVLAACSERWSPKRRSP